MRKARRICAAIELYDPVKPFMTTLHREVTDKDEKMGRVRDARPGEKTLYGDMCADDVKHFFWDIDPHTGKLGETHHEQPHANYFYNDVDAAEDLMLFPEEAAGESKKAITDAGAFRMPELELPNMKRYAYSNYMHQTLPRKTTPFVQRQFCGSRGMPRTRKSC